MTAGHYTSRRFRSLMRFVGTRTLLVILMVSFMSVSAALAATSPPQPSSGPGGSDYSNASVRSSSYGVGNLAYYLFEPGNPQPTTAPVIVFVHGYGGTNPMSYGAWINHLVRRGNIVIYPKYQSMTSMIGGSLSYTSNCVSAVKDALNLLKTGSHIRPDLNKFAIVGHSYGGILAVNIAALAKQAGLPTPKAVTSVEPGISTMVPLQDLSLIPATTLLLTIVGDRDFLVGNRDAKKIFRRTSQIPIENKNYITMVSDNHGLPGLTADHFAPTCMAPTGGSLLPSIGNLGSNFGGFLPGFGNLLPTLGNLGSNLGDLLPGIGDLLPILGNLGSNLPGWLPDPNNYLPIFGNFLPILGNLGSNLPGWLTDPNGDLPIFVGFIPRLGNLGSNLPGLLPDPNNYLPIFGTFLPPFGNLGSNFGGLLPDPNEVFPIFAGFIPKLGNLGSNLPGLLPPLNGDLPTLGGTLQQYFDNLVSNFGGSIPSLPSLGNLGSNLGGFLMGQNGYLPIFGSFIPKLGNLGSNLPGLLPTLNGDLPTLRDILGQYSGNILGQHLNDLISNLDAFTTLDTTSSIPDDTSTIPDQGADVETTSNAEFLLAGPGTGSSIGGNFMSFIPMFGTNALDYYCTWKLFDGLTDAAFYNRNREYALGNTQEQRYMGVWSDGKPVKELNVTANP
jgi:dienelactone hydrolase